MSRYTKKQFSFPVDEKSFVSVFRDNGFDTFWLTIQDEAPVIKSFCEESKNCIDLKDKKYDIDLLKNFEKITKNIQKDTLIVFHTLGSHYDYNERVPKKFQKFQPIYTKNYTENKQKLDNSYDNTIVYIDKFLFSLVEILQHYNSFFIYSSDHGESLGEKQYGIFAKYGHASPIKIAPKQQLNVPFIFWYSNIFKNNNKNNIYIKKQQKISHDFIFNSILGCANFKGAIDQKLNICQEK
jgi:glucan phosphoethanolaminetransferase (alkaline phosphatase superfamily)